MIEVLPRNEHWYQSKTDPSVYYPSVTTVNQMPKGKYFEKYLADQESYEESQRLLHEAGERGTRVHDASEKIEAGKKVYYGELNEDEYELLMGFINWHKEYNPECIEVEKVLVSDKLKVGGKMDRLYKIGDEYIVFDLKTSKTKIFDYHWTQTSAYAHMVEEEMGIKVHKTAILRMTPRAKKLYQYEERKRTEWLKDLKQFKRNLDTYYYQNGEKVKPKIKLFPEYLSLK